MRFEILLQIFLLDIFHFSSRSAFGVLRTDYLGVRVVPVDTGRKLDVHKTFRRRPGRLLNVLCTFNLRPLSTGVACLYKLAR